MGEVAFRRPARTAPSSGSIEAQLASHAVRSAYESMAQDILDAVEINGYSRKQTYGEALSAARNRLYLEAFNELNRKGGPREEQLGEAVKRLQRLDAPLKWFKTSMKRRFESSNQPMTPAERRFVTKAWMKERSGASTKRDNINDRIRAQLRGA